jgi:hypothetical protein
VVLKEGRIKQPKSLENQEKPGNKIAAWEAMGSRKE